MKKLIFILLAVGLPLGVATLANPAGLTLAGWPAMTALALGAFAIQWLAFIPARLFQTERFYDLTGSITYIAVTLAAVSIATAPASAQWLIAIMIFLWAGRLGSFLFRRIRAAGGDQRFDHIKVSSSRFFCRLDLTGCLGGDDQLRRPDRHNERCADSGRRCLCRRRCDVDCWLRFRGHRRSAEVSVQRGSGQRGAFYQYRIVGPLSPSQLLW